MCKSIVICDLCNSLKSENIFMKHIGLLFSMIIAGSTLCKAQTDSYLHTRYTIEQIATNSGSLNSAAIKTVGANIPPGTIGDVYLTKNFNISVFQLYEKEQLVEGFFAKLDLKNNEFDVKIKSGIKALDGNMVKSFIYDDSLTRLRHSFVNAKEWKTNEGGNLLGFFEILSEGEITLAGYAELEFIKANYNAAKHVGSKDNKYVKNSRYYYVINQVATVLPKRKSLFDIFGERKDELEKYSEDHSLNLRNTLDLIRLFDFYNQSTTTK